MKRLKIVTQKRFLVLFGLLLAFLFNCAQAQPSLSALFHQPNDPIAGNPNGTVTVVEFFDYGCAHCLTMANTVASIIKNNPHVRFVFKETPMNGPTIEYATRAALAANKQGKYFQFSHALLATHGRLTKERILTIAKAKGIDVEKLKTDMFEAGITNQIRGNFQLWHNYHLTGTPSFFIGRSNSKSLNHVRYVLGEMSQRELQYEIDNAR